MSQFHFISGLPKSGSTLLSGILMQNPDFHAGMISPVGSLINGVLEQIGAGNEFYSFFDEKKRKRVCRSIFDSYYQDEQDKEVIFDFIGQPYFDHDFENVEYAKDDFDYTLGVKGLHTVQRKVEFKPRKTILPPDLLQKYREMTFWADTSGSSANVIVPKKNKLRDTNLFSNG